MQWERNRHSSFCLPRAAAGAALWLLAACAPLSGGDAVASVPTDFPQPKVLATIALSATPDDGQRAATEAAGGAATAAARATAAVVFAATPRQSTPTPYIGVFIGGGDGGDDAPLLDPSVYAGTRIASVPTPTISACPIPPDPTFGTLWTNDATVVRQLGCPGEPSTPYPGTTQVFERGVMYGLPTGEYWAIASNTIGGRYWYFPASPPDLPLEVAVPDGLRAPTGGFGIVWRAYSDIRTALGFARADEAQADMSLQRFTGGALLYDASSVQVFALLGNSGNNPGIAYGPY